METIVTKKTNIKTNKITENLSVQEFFVLQTQSEAIFEYDKGEVIPIESMKNQERILVANILRKFQQTKAYQNFGELLPETDCWLTENQMRRPDIAFFTKEQIKESSENKNPIPDFVIEIISENDTINQVENKTKEYFEAGVKLVWQIFPNFEMVRVFTSRKKCYTFFDNDEFDAAPVIEDLRMKVADIFKR